MSFLQQRSTFDPHAAFSRGPHHPRQARNIDALEVVKGCTLQDERPTSCGGLQQSPLKRLWKRPARKMGASRVGIDVSALAPHPLVRDNRESELLEPWE
jgi:hypothetical protein